MPATVFSAKVIGTISIGIWAGYNASLVYSPSGQLGVNALNAGTLGLKQLGSLGCAIGKALKGKKTNANGESKEAKTEEEKESTGVSTKEEGSKASSPSISLRAAIDYSLTAVRVSALSGVTLIANIVAYTSSSRSGKHPYLIYLALGAPLVGVLQFYGARELRSQVESRAGAADHSETSSEESGDLSASTYEHVSLPGQQDAGHDASEKHEFSLSHKYSIWSSVVSALSGFLFAISVVGLAGESARA